MILCATPMLILRNRIFSNIICLVYYYTSPSINTTNLEIVILVNIYGYMFRLILSHLQAYSIQNSGV